MSVPPAKVNSRIKKSDLTTSIQLSRYRLSTTQMCQMCKAPLELTVVRSILDRLCSACSLKPQAFKSCVMDATTGKQRGKPVPEQKLGVTVNCNTATVVPNNLHIPGVKDDQGKLRWDLLPWKAVQGLIRVMTFGAKKYTPNGWRSVPDARSRYLAALLRHLYALNAGEKIDPESSLRHIDHVLCNAAFLSELED